MQVPNIPTLGNLTSDVQQAFNVLIKYLNSQDSGVQSWTRSFFGGVLDASSALAGIVGEFKTAVNSAGTSVGTSATNITNIVLTAGDWLVFSSAGCNDDSAAGNAYLQLGFSSHSASFTGTQVGQTQIFVNVVGDVGNGVMVSLVNISSSVTFYLVGAVPTNATTVKGYMYALRFR